MSRNIIIPDDLESRTREAVKFPAFVDNTKVLAEFLSILDASYDAELVRAAKHDADNRALGALINPCTCGDPTKSGIDHHYTAPCVPDADSIGW